MERLDGFQLRIEQDEPAIAAAFKCMLAIPDVRHVVLERGKQEGAKLAFSAVRSRVAFGLQKRGEKSLDHVLRITGRVSTPPREAVERRPIVATELLEGRDTRLIRQCTIRDYAPTGCPKRRPAILQSPGDSLHIVQITETR
jgi:hypothetical protein